MNKMN